MKKSLLSIPLLALLASCSNDDLLTQQSDFISNITITAENIRMAEPELVTRTDLSVTSSGLQFAWAASDVVGIYPNEGDQVSFPMTKGAGTQSANFDGGGWAVKASSTYAAYFPYDAGNTYYGRSYTALPFSYTGQRQTANSSTAHLGAYDYMVATASAPSNGTIAFNFTHINSFLYIQLTTPDAATFTQLTLSAEDAVFTEEATVNISTGVITPSKTAKSATLALDDIAVSANGTLYTWLAVTPTDLSGKTLTAALTAKDGTIYKTDIAGKKMETGRAYILSGTLAPENNDPVYTYVDLGLSVKWATFNVGASSPEDCGDYYAWGEIKTKDTYNWSNYKWCNGSQYSLTKYCTYSNIGIVDNKNVLDSADDVAYVKWGSNWRMPTKAEQDELRNNCTWTWTTQNGVNGYTVLGPNGNSIFLPAAGCSYEGSPGYIGVGLTGYYWSTTSEGNTNEAYNVFFRSDFVSGYNYKHSRDLGQSVRPVYDDSSKLEHESVDLGLSVKWATCNVGASTPVVYGDYYAWGEIETKAYYNWATYKWCGGTGFSLTKYCNSASNGTVDSKTFLDIADDVAQAKWGGNWRIPTYDELNELVTLCDWTSTTINGIYGYKVTGINGNSIFLPAAGCRNEGNLNLAGSDGGYWSSSLSANYQASGMAVSFNSGGVTWSVANRYCGRSVRPVCLE